MKNTALVRANSYTALTPGKFELRGKRTSDIIQPLSFNSSFELEQLFSEDSNFATFFVTMYFVCCVCLVPRLGTDRAGVTFPNSILIMVS